MKEEESNNVFYVCVCVSMVSSFVLLLDFFASSYGWKNDDEERETAGR